MSKRVTDFIRIRISVCNFLCNIFLFFALTKQPDSFSTEQFFVGRNQVYVLNNEFTRWAHMRFA